MQEATVHQLKTFVLVADTGSFAKAANLQEVSPAAISEQIRTLEKKLGYSLLDRRPGKSPVINKNGLALLRRIPALLEKVGEINNLSGELTSRIHKVRVGVGYYIYETQFFQNLARFYKEHPDISIELSSLFTKQEALRKIAGGEIDLAYFALSEEDREPDDPFITTCTMGLFISPQHPILRTWRPDGSECLPMLMPLAGTHFDRTVERRLVNCGITKFDVTARAQHSATRIKMALEGMGVVYALYDEVAFALKDNTLIDLDVRFPTLYRQAFRRADASKFKHFQAVDNFATHILRTGSDHSTTPTAPRSASNAH